MAAIAIGKLAEIASTKVQTIRYYEEIGLIQPFSRTEGGHRLYGPEDASRLKFIRHSRELGSALRKFVACSIYPIIPKQVVRQPMQSRGRSLNK